MTTDPIVLSTLLAELSLRQLPCGGWAALASSSQPAIEPTCYSALALGSAPVGDIERAQDFLLHTQNPNGSWPVFPGDDQEGGWVTSLAVMALRDLVPAIPARLQGLPLAAELCRQGIELVLEMEVSYRRSPRSFRPRQVWLAMVSGHGQLGCSHRIRDSCSEPAPLLLRWFGTRPVRALIVASRCSSIVPAPVEDGMPVTALSMEPPLHRTLTIRPSRSWRCVIANRTQLCKAPSTTWSELPQLLRRHGVSPGRFLLSPHTVGRLLRFPARLPPFLISQAPRTPARLRWSASHLINSAR